MAIIGVVLPLLALAALLTCTLALPVPPLLLLCLCMLCHLVPLVRLRVLTIHALALAMIVIVAPSQHGWLLPASLTLTTMMWRTLLAYAQLPGVPLLVILLFVPQLLVLLLLVFLLLLPPLLLQAICNVPGTPVSPRHMDSTLQTLLVTAPAQLALERRR